MSLTFSTQREGGEKLDEYDENAGFPCCLAVHLFDIKLLAKGLF